MINSYRFSGKLNKHGIPRYVVLGRNDTVLDYREAEEFYRGCSITEITDEEHHASNCIGIYLVEDGEDINSETYYDFTGSHSHITVYNDESEFKGYFSYPHYASLKGGDGWYAWTESVHYVYTSECTEEGLALFKRYGD